jgi:leader peptidase (prepilin peptidase)/N-methyltransferase
VIPGSILLIILAPFVGSFLGTLAQRLPAGIPYALSRSVCDHCNAKLHPRQLIPIVSWVFQRGQCRTCGAWLGFFYPSIELAAAGIAVWAAVVMPAGPAMWATCIFGWTLLTLAVIDWRHQILPDQLTLSLLVLGLTVAYATVPEDLSNRLIGAAVGFFSFLTLRKIYQWLRHREGLGLGDVKLLAGIGAWVSWVSLPSVVLLAALLGLLTVLIKACLGWRIKQTDRVPFGTFLAVSAWLVWLYGPLMLS